ncbi:hypothetical protein M3M33_16140, partial [Loigolactobacillus coryniformis]|uniref:hypothetical protein n=1 Tax=Loigolactobacillus coryniformis TaxID=1610 RepID=UPI00201AD800
LDDIILVSNGDVRFTIDGVPYDLLAMDFRQCVTWADVVKVIQAKLLNGFVEATATGFKVASKKVGSTASTVAIGAATGGTGT